MGKFVKLIDVPKRKKMPEYSVFFAGVYYKGRKVFLESSGNPRVDELDRIKLIRDVKGRLATIYGAQP